MAIRSKRIQFLTGEGSFSEQYGRGLQYALVNDDGRQVHHFVWCKDFLHDVFFGAINSEKISVHRFKYDPDSDIGPPLSRTRIALANLTDKNFQSKVENSVEFMNQVEKELRFSKTTAFRCIDPPEKYKATGVFLFDGSKQWLRSPVLLSMYTLLVRIGMVHTRGMAFRETLTDISEGKIEPYQKYDQQYSTEALPGINRILRDRPGRIFHRTQKENYPEKLDGYTIHHRFGIITFSKGDFRHVMPAKWYKDVPPLKNQATTP